MTHRVAILLASALVLATGCAGAPPPPGSLTPDEQAALCRNLERAQEQVDRVYCKFPDDDSQLACAAFTGQLAGFRELYRCP